MAQLRDKVQNALDEARLLILGTQVLLGFQLRAVFEKGFDKLPAASQYLDLVALGLLLITLALLVWPGAYHRLVENGEDTKSVHEFATGVMEVALAPFAIGLGLNIYVAVEKVGGRLAGIISGASAALAAIIAWYVSEAIVRRVHRTHEQKHDSKTEEDSSHEATYITDKIEHVLTETRVVLPGAQALLGFQFLVILTEPFDNLPQSSKVVHLLSLGFITLSIVLLMTPAAYHRIVERGEETEHFHRFASSVLLAAMIPLALGLSGDLFVVTRKVLGNRELAITLAGLTLLLCYGLWFGLTSYWSSEHRHEARASKRGSRRPVSA
jgi:uncharacterized protein DUF6328